MGVEIVASEEVWIRSTAPDTTYNADFLEARRTDEVRYGVAQFNLQHLQGERITGVDLVLDELGSGEGAGSSASFPAATRAVAIAVEDKVPDILSMTWNRYHELIGGQAERPFEELGMFDLKAPGSIRSDQTSSGSASDIAVLQQVLDGSGILTLVLQPREPGFPIAASFGDGELNGRDAMLRVTLGRAVYAGVHLAGNERVSFEFRDGEDSAIVRDSARLRIDGFDVIPIVEYDDPITRVIFRPKVLFELGSIHSFQVAALDTLGMERGAQGEFKIGIPRLPLTGLPGPAGTASGWGLRQIWDTGTIDSLDAAVAAAQQTGGAVSDTFVSTIHHFESSDPGLGGLIPGDQPLPAESLGLSSDNFVIVGHILVEHSGGDLSIGVHSDDGFGLRVVGGHFNSVHGAGERDEAFPSTMFHVGNTSDSNTRGILRSLPAGEYPIEFIAWDSTDGAFFQVYAAAGAFETDFANPDPWFLIGDPNGPLRPLVGSDTDGDGISDSYERANGLDFMKPDADLDLDGDGLSNGEESALLTLANSADSDGDGLLDGVETGARFWEGAMRTGSDPLRSDTDGDGLLDGVEMNTGRFLDATNTGTSPTVADSDYDGVLDGVEVELGSDPTDSLDRLERIVVNEEVWIRSVSPERTFDADFLDARRTDEVRYGLAQFDLRQLRGETVVGVELILDEQSLVQGGGSSAEMASRIDAFAIAVAADVPDLLTMNWNGYQAAFEGMEDAQFESLGSLDLPPPLMMGGERRTIGSGADAELIQRIVDGTGVLTLVLKPREGEGSIAASFGDGELNGRDAELIVQMAGLDPRFVLAQVRRFEGNLLLQWQSEMDGNNGVEVSFDLVKWVPFGPVQSGASVKIAIEPAASTLRFYRVRRLP